MSVWYRVRDLDAGAGVLHGTCSGSRRRFADEEGRWAQLRREDMEIALWEAQGDEGGVASVTVPDLRAEVERLRAAGVGGRRHRRAARAGADRRRLRPGRQPHPAHRGSRVIRPAGAQDLPFLRDMLRHALLRALGERGGRPARALRRRLGPAGRQRARRDRRVPAGRRRVVPAVRAGRARLRLRRRADARADDRDRAEPPRPRPRRASCSPRCSSRRGRTATSADQPQRRARQPRDPSVRAARLREGRRARRRVGDAARRFRNRPERIYACPVRCRARPAGPRTMPGESSVASAEARSLVVCPACGAPNTPGVKFCGECGAALGAPGRAAPPASRRACRRAEARLGALRRPRRLHRRVRGPRRRGHA